MKRTAFDLFHPVVAFGYFAVMFALSMTAMQPVYLAISLASVLSYSAVLRGWRATGRSLLWQLPLVAVVALANPLFSASGSTELFRLGLRAFYLESFVYGACMGVMLISVIVLFSNASQVLTSDKVMTLFGGVAPTIGLMLSMTARLVPQFLRRGNGIADVERACTAARPAEEPAGKLAVMRGYLRRTSVLMGWGMEDSLETAGAMKARGWGSRAPPTARYRFRRFDAAALACGGALAAGRGRRLGGMRESALSDDRRSRPGGAIAVRCSRACRSQSPRRASAI
ncbi:MAG: energy-coupling factor transporter transmembrane component T [Eggerthella lenta]